MLTRPCLLILLALVVAPLCSCGTVQKKLLSRKQAKEKKDESAESRDVFLGIVESVNPEQKFVLVRLDRRMQVATGTTLDVRSPGGLKSTLVVTPEHKMNFLSADITSGVPAVGDTVMLPPQAVPAPALAPAPDPVPGPTADHPAASGTQSAPTEPPQGAAVVPSVSVGPSEPLPPPVR